MAICSMRNLKLHMEIPLLLMFFSFFLTQTICTNLVIFRTCYVMLGYNETECALLGSDKADNFTNKLEKLVEPHASVILMTRSVCESIVCAIIASFVGPWSDKFGRKPILIVSLLGIVISSGSTIIFSIIPSLSPWWYLMFCSVPILLTGGFYSYMTVALCYVTDVTPEADRGVRMGLFEAALSIGILLGNVVSAYILNSTSYPVVFGIGTACLLLALLYVIFYVPESVVNRETEGKIRGFFDTENLHLMLKATFRKRTNYDRAIILLSVVTISVYIMAINADTAVVFLYLRNSFKWSLKQYQLYSSTHNIFWILGTFFGIYALHKYLRITELVLILIGFISMMNGVLVQGLATKSWHIYFAGGIRGIGGVISPMIRSFISKTTPSDEIGKIFPVIVISESLFGLLGSPLYTPLYNHTLDTMPELFNFVTAGLYLVMILLTIILMVLQYKNFQSGQPYNALGDEIENVVAADSPDMLVTKDEIDT